MRVKKVPKKPPEKGELYYLYLERCVFTFGLNMNLCGEPE